MTLPYENASSGKAAVGEVERILRGFGAQSFGVMEHFDEGVVVMQFIWRERQVSIKASAKGYAQAWLREHPWSYRSRATRIDHEKRALKQGNIAVYSILRDWIKGQITAVETGILSFDAAFLGQIMLPNGETIMERVQQGKMLEIA